MPITTIIAIFFSIEQFVAINEQSNIPSKASRIDPMYLQKIETLKAYISIAYCDFADNHHY